MYRIIGSDGREYGPISAEQLSAWLAEGRAHAQTLASVPGSGIWKPLAAFPELAIQLSRTAPGPVAPPSLSSSLAPAVRTNGFAMAGMVLGIISVTVGFCCCYGIPLNILGLIFSLVALYQIQQQPQHYDGKGPAIAGLILSLFSIFIAILLTLFAVANAGWIQSRHHLYRL